MKRSTELPPHPPGFTLIEILVTLSIIAVVAAIVAQSLNAVRNRGKERAIEVDIKQLTNAILAYYTDLANAAEMPIKNGTLLDVHRLVQQNYLHSVPGSVSSLNGQGGSGDTVYFLAFSGEATNVTPTPVPGLTAFWPADDDTDDWASNNDAKVEGDVTLGEGRYGKALTFHGTEHAVKLGPDESFGNFGTGSFSLMFHVKTTKTTGKYALFAKADGCLGTNYFRLRLDDGRPLAQLSDGTSGAELHADVNVADNEFHHLAFVRAAKVVLLYVDGLVDKSFITSDVVNIDNAAQFGIGSVDPCTQSPGGDGTGFLGSQIDEIKLFDRAVSAAEVRQAEGNVVTELQMGGTPTPTPTPTSVPSGPYELTINGMENVNITFNGAYAFGIWLQDGWDVGFVNATPADSQFTFTFKSGSTTVGTMSFDPPLDTAVFRGAVAPSAFTRVEIRETVGSDENDFFGYIYLAETVPSAPASLTVYESQSDFVAASGATRRVGYPSTWQSVMGEPYVENGVTIANASGNNLGVIDATPLLPAP